MNKPPDETLKQGRNRSWLLVNMEQDIQNFVQVINIKKY